MYNDRRGISRRQFLGYSSLTLGSMGLLKSLPLAGQCPTGPVGPIDCKPPFGPTTPFQPDTSLPVRTRWSVFDPAGAQNLIKLEQAYQQLRALTQSNPSDPRGWMQQANVHCWYCGGGQDAAAGEEIHGCWWFFPWHRCYLYFHERILGSLINDPTLTLPYWNWDDVANSSHLGVPPPYFLGALNDSNREAALLSRMGGKYVDVYGVLPNDPNLLLNDSDNWFGTDPNGNPPSNGGVIENGPHGYVHLWVGAANEPDLCSSNPPYGKPDMGVLATAAQDPVFFAHHCNIDRLWDVWLSYQSGRSNPAWPQDHSWTFYNANYDGTGEWVTIEISDVLNHEQSLRYQYATPAAAPMNVVSQSQPALLGTVPVTQTITIPPEVRTRLAAPAASEARKGGEYILHIELEMSSNQGAFVHVFGNLPEATAEIGTDHPNFLGYFAIVPSGSHDHTGTKHVLVDVTRSLPAVAQGNSSLAVTLVPKVNPKLLTAAQSKIKVQRIYLTRE